MKQSGNTLLKCIDLNTALQNAAQRSALDLETLKIAEGFLNKIRVGGDSAIKMLAADFGESGRVYSSSELQDSLNAIDPKFLAMLRRVAGRIKSFAQSQRDSFSDLTVEEYGAKLSHRLSPVERAGCYVPGGRYPLPSSLLMTAMTAKVAGVTDIVVCCPKPSEIILAAAALCGVEKVIALGGVQAIAAMSFGYEGVAPRDVIAGPGNRWVSAAKQLLNGNTRMDLPAGPTEIVVVVDADADPDFAAADLLAQAEHDPEAWPVVIALEGFDFSRLQVALEKLLQKLSTRATAIKALGNGFCVFVKESSDAAKLVNELAPEHLSLQLKFAESFAAMCKNYGTLFVGPQASEALADYGIGPNHVLPTGGAARKYGALSVLNFLRLQTRIDAFQVDEHVLTDAFALAKMEGLEGHAASIILRLNKAEVSS
jgi:histidinol dehydrogenase